jgi:hypothetical protein
MRLRTDRRPDRVREAAERNALWAKLSSAEKLEQLNRRLGVGVGAKRQRRLLNGEGK